MSSLFDMKELHNSLIESKQMDDVEMKPKRPPSPIVFDLNSKQDAAIKQEADPYFTEDRQGSFAANGERKWTKHVYRMQQIKSEQETDDDDCKECKDDGDETFKWTKHAYKNRIMSMKERKKLLFPDKVSTPKREQGKVWDLRDKVIQRRQYNNTRANVYLMNLSNMTFPTSNVKKSFAIHVDRRCSSRYVQMSIQTKPESPWQRKW